MTSQIYYRRDDRTSNANLHANLSKLNFNILFVISANVKACRNIEIWLQNETPNYTYILQSISLPVLKFSHKLVWENTIFGKERITIIIWQVKKSLERNSVSFKHIFKTKPLKFRRRKYNWSLFYFDTSLVKSGLLWKTQNWFLNSK